MAIKDKISTLFMTVLHFLLVLTHISHGCHLISVCGSSCNGHLVWVSTVSCPFFFFFFTVLLNLHFHNTYLDTAIVIINFGW
jgi:hypothetical protein